MTVVILYGVIRTPPVGRWARFLIGQREARGWTQERAFEELRGGLGLGPKSRASYIALEHGKRQPRESEQRFLVAFYRAEPTDDEPQPPTDDLAAAIREQAEAIRALVEEMRLARERDQDAAAAMMRAAEVLLSVQPRPGAAASTARGVPAESAR